MEPNYNFFISHLKVLEVEKLLLKLFQATERLSTRKNLNHFPLAEEIRKIDDDNIIRYKNNRTSHALTRRDNQAQSFSLETLDIRKFHELVINEIFNLLNRCRLDCFNALQRNTTGVTDIKDFFVKIRRNYHLNFFHLSFRRIMINDVPFFRPCDSVVLRDDGTTLSYVFENGNNFSNEELIGIFRFQTRQLYENNFFFLLFTLEEMKLLIKKFAELKKKRDNEVKEGSICFLRSIYREIEVMRNLRPREFEWNKIYLDDIEKNLDENNILRDQNLANNLFASQFDNFLVEIQLT